ncbi:hypothetical protein K5I29_10365 [Flavobacterium agricola]|uniref:Uncharacterized protein n=1 Tax=Flavobacterium agricola TaxID=2870839 RepID=A0ABY6LZL5_9FLAO|nr:hypothetical protein [Flavobacterium agricola]UYW00900.1 hypothetical protein K5I29_10365 [Flavobacterium agricola]
MTNHDNISTIPCVTSDQIDRLYCFTRKHFVEHYDLQTELVDHLARGIECQWEQNSALTFEEALQAEFKKFGVFGFSDIVAQRQAALQKRYHAFVWQHFKDFFTLPKVLFTISLLAIVAAVLPLFSAYYVESVLGISILLLFLVLFLTIKNKYQLKKTKNEKRWMMEDVIANMGGSAALFYIPIQVFFSTSMFLNLNQFWVNLLIAAFLVSWMLYSYIMIHVIPQKAQSYLQTIYPEYKYIM